MKLIPLRGKYGKGKFTLVDNKDFVWASKTKWHAHKNGDSLYARNGKGYKLHRLILNLEKGGIADHINRNTLDNRRCNLRITDALGNVKNVGIRKDNSSNFKGVNFWVTGKKWVARIQVNKKRVFLGYFKTAKEAAKMYNLASKKYHQEFAYINHLTKI